MIRLTIPADSKARMISPYFIVLRKDLPIPVTEAIP